MDSRVEAARIAPSARNRRGWLIAIALWTAFLGAALNLLAGLLLLPAEATHALDWHALSVLFLAGWLLTLVPVGLALMLALPLPAAGGDGR
jgi:hypothetical protein